MENLWNLKKSVYFPTLSRKLDEERLQESIGLSDWSTRIHSIIDDKKYLKLNSYVEITLLKGYEDVKYEIIENDREIIVRYYWKDFDKKNLEIDDELE